MSDFTISPLSPGNGSLEVGGIKKAAGSGFSKVLEDSIAAVNSTMQKADALESGLVSGQHSNIHETMIAMEKADISFRLVTKVQTKVVDAYKEIMRLQL